LAQERFSIDRFARDWNDAFAAVLYGAERNGTQPTWRSISVAQAGSKE
jgi:hypothetical protein